MLLPSFDVVSELEIMEVENAVNQTKKEIQQRFDFKGGKSSIVLDKERKVVLIMADDDFKMRSMHQILESKLAKRDVDIRCLNYGEEEAASGNLIKQTVTLRSGLAREETKEITKFIKETKLKVQAQVQGEQVRVTAKKIDDLQALISAIKEKSLPFPLQFINMRR
jgi:cyclic-di-GMP-binding protein